MQLITKTAVVGFISVMTTVASATVVKADLLGHVIVGGVTNQALTDVTKNDCQNATGAGQAACAVPETIVDVHKDISHAETQAVQNACQNASGVGEDTCSAIDDVNSLHKQISEQVSHIHLFGSPHDSSNSSPNNSPNSSPNN